MPALIPAIEAIKLAAAPVEGAFATFAGSVTACAVASNEIFYAADLLDIPGIEFQYSDVDCFVASEIELGSVVRAFLDAGGVMSANDSVKWRRWRKQGSAHFHTNSIKIEMPSGVVVNPVLKTHGNQIVRTHAQTAEAFDFGHVCVGFDLRTMSWKDHRAGQCSKFRPGNRMEFHFIDDKLEDWENGVFTDYNGVRQPSRWARHVSKGFHHLLQAGPSLALGLEEAAGRLRVEYKDTTQLWLGQEFYPMLITAIRNEDITELLELDMLLEPGMSIEFLMEHYTGAPVLVPQEDEGPE